MNPSDVALAAAIPLGLTGIGLFAKGEYRQPANSRFYLFMAGAGVVLLAVVAGARFQDTFLESVIFLPAFFLAGMQVPLAAFDDLRRVRLPVAMIVLSALLMGAYFALSEPTGTWQDALESFALFSGLPLGASAWRLASFLAGVPGRDTLWIAVRRFVIWLAVALGPGFVAFTLSYRDRLVPIGELIFAASSIVALVAAVSMVRHGLFGRREPAVFRRLLLVLAPSVCVAFIGLLLAGNLIRNRNVNAGANRSLLDRLYGCGSSSQFTEWVITHGAEFEGALARAIDAPELPDDPKPGGANVDPELSAAVTLARVAAFAYLSCADMLGAAKRWNQPDIHVLPLGFGAVPTASGLDVTCPAPNTPSRDEGVIVVNSRNVILSFRGTDNWRDVVTDLTAIPTDLVTPDWTHRGFADAWARLRPETLARLKEGRKQDQSVWVAGHSLGGAIAILAADDLQRNGIPVHAVYTFGQPRLVSARLARAIDERLPNLYRFNLLSDPVPLAGPLTATTPGQRRYIDSQGQVHTDVDTPRELVDGRCAGGLHDVEAHGKAHYAVAISRISGVQ